MLLLAGAGVLAVRSGVLESFVSERTDVAAPSPAPSPSPEVTPTETPEVSAFPDADELGIVGRLPTDVSGCERSDVGPSGATSRISCVSGPNRLQLNAFETRAAAEAELAARVEELGAPEGNCLTSSFAVGPFTMEGVRSGYVLCYVIDGDAWIEWTWTDPVDPSVNVYAWAHRSDDDDASLYDWWTWHAALL